MLVYAEIVHIYFWNNLTLSRQGEACKDYIDASKTPRSVSHFLIFEKLILWLRALLDCAESDSAQCSLRSVWLRAVLVCMGSLAVHISWISPTTTNLSAKLLQPVNQEPRWIGFMEKKIPKNLVTLPR